MTVSYNSGYYSFIQRLLLFFLTFKSEPGSTVPIIIVQWEDTRETTIKAESGSR